jgi:hypothetical protein
MRQRILSIFLAFFGIAAAASTAFSLTTQECFTLSFRELLNTPIEDSARHDRLWEWLRRSNTKGAQVVELVSRDPKIKNLLGKETGTDEGADTIVKHSFDLYDNFYEQLPHSPIGSINTPENIDVPNLIKFIVALHDIGKPLALEKTGETDRQHEFTIPIMEKMMRRLGFNEPEIDLSKAIVGNDIMGEFFMQLLTPKQAHDELEVLASRTTLNPRDFFSAQSFFYTIDAASYPSLRRTVFKENKNGALDFVDPRYRKLRRMFESSKGDLRLQRPGLQPKDKTADFSKSELVTYKADVRGLRSLGYSTDVAQRVARGFPAMAKEILAARRKGKPVIGWRGFAGSFQEYNPQFSTKAQKGQIWFATQMSDPAGYVNLSAESKYGDDDYDGRQIQLPVQGYIIEYEIPGNLTQKQNGEFDSPQSGPPKIGKSPRSRAERGTWGFYERKSIPDEAPFIKYVYLPKSARLSKEPVKIRGAGTFRIKVIRADYYRLRYDQAFVGGKLVSEIPQGAPVIRVTHYEQDPN